MGAAMRRVLFSFIPVLVSIACAHAQSSTTTIQDFGLVGKWAIECSRPPGPANEHSLFAVTSSGIILVMNDFGPDYDGADRTIDTHVTNLRRKIGPDAPRHIVTVHGVGYRLQVEE